MRFKKLRIAVGISIVLFIFIAGTIILLGAGKTKQTQNSANTLAPVTNKSLTSSTPAAQNSNTQSPSTQTNTQTNNYQAPVVYHPMMMTGAS